MKRRLNYTNRYKITRDRIKLNIIKTVNGSVSFSVNLDIDDLSFNKEAKIYIDAYHGTEIKRFEFGTIEHRSLPQDLSLTNLAYTDNIQFRLLIVDETEINGLILAHADRLGANLENRKTILPVRFEDIDQQVWMLSYGGFEGSPILVLNNKIPNIQNIAKSSPLFFMYVYPAVVREIITHMVFVDNIVDINEISLDWHNDWLKFIKTVNPNLKLPELLNPLEEGFELDEVTLWIDKVVGEFCNYRREWKEFLKTFTKERN